MNYGLREAFIRVLQEASAYGGNRYLALLGKQVEEIDACQSTELRYSKERLQQMLANRGMALDGRLSKVFIEELGEAHFHVIAIRSGLNLVRVACKKGQKTPDFSHPGPSEIYFEVKTPSVDRGEYGIKDAIEDALDGRIDQLRQLDSGRRVALVELVVAPYGSVCYEVRKTRLIEVLQNKIRNNLKREQFATGPTFLVCSLLSLHPDCRADCSLRPVYTAGDDQEYSAPVTGHLWMTAFSDPGMLVHSKPEFEGARGIEGTIKRAGILVGDEYEFVKGIIFVIYNLDGCSRIVCLVRSDDELMEPLTTLVGPLWNDRYDSNGWQLSGLSRTGFPGDSNT